MAKYTENYQITNPAGEPVGPPQIFEAETKDEMIAKLKAAHQNAAAKFYETKRAVKLGLLMEPDPDRPIQEFVEQPLTADDRIRIANDISNSSTQDAGLTRWIEAKFGAPLNVIRENLQEVEQNKYIRFVQEQIKLFRVDHPEYNAGCTDEETEINRSRLIQYLQKQGWPITKKNLEIAFTDLSEDSLIISHPVNTNETVVDPATVATVEPQPAPHSETEITVPVTTASPISENAPAVRPAVSSSGIRRNDSSVGVTPSSVQPKGITIQEVNAMSSTQYAERLRSDPNFKKQVEDLFAGKK